MAVTWANVQVTLGELKPWADNPRLSSKRKARRILDSWRKFGQVQTVAIGPSNEVYDGHQRLSALLTVHGPSYQVDARRSDRELTDEERRALAIALHAGAVGSWNWDNLANWDAGELQEWGFDSETLTTWQRDVGALGNLLQSEKAESADAEPQIDRAAELNEKWQVKPGDLWRIGEHRLACGDCTDKAVVERLLQGDIPFLCVTDPPYGVNYDPQWRSDAAKNGHLAYAARRVGKVLNDDRPDWRAAWELFPGDVIYSWHPPGATSLIHAAALQDSGFAIRMQIIWAKSNFPIGRGDYHVRHEPCWYAVRNGKKAHRTDDRTQTTLWEINLDRNVDGGHSTQKPLECMARPIRNHEAAEIYDPFLGSGTTLVACQNLHRRGRGIEIRPEYCAVVLERMATAFPGIEIERVTVG